MCGLMMRVPALANSSEWSMSKQRKSLVLKEGLKSDIEYRCNDFFNVNLCPNVLIFVRLP